VERHRGKPVRVAGALLVVVVVAACSAPSGEICIANSADELSSLARRTSLDCDVVVKDTDIEHIPSFDSSTARGFEVVQNSLLSDLAGIDSFTEGDQLIIESNRALGKIDLQAKTIWREIAIADNGGVSDINIAATKVSRLAVAQEDTLESIAAENVSSFDILELRDLTNLQVLTVTAAVKGKLVVKNCPKLSVLQQPVAQSKPIEFTHCGNADDDPC
jgi:hypothetical protein